MARTDRHGRRDAVGGDQSGRRARLRTYQLGRPGPRRKRLRDPHVRLDDGCPRRDSPGYPSRMR